MNITGSKHKAASYFLPLSLFPCVKNIEMNDFQMWKTTRHKSVDIEKRWKVSYKRHSYHEQLSIFSPSNLIYRREVTITQMWCRLSACPGALLLWFCDLQVCEISWVSCMWDKLGVLYDTDMSLPRPSIVSQHSTELCDIKLKWTCYDSVLQVVREKHLSEKLVYVASVVTLVLLAYSVLEFHWLLPYYYTVSMPLLLTIRAVVYWYVLFTRRIQK